MKPKLKVTDYITVRSEDLDRLVQDVYDRDFVFQEEADYDPMMNMSWGMASVDGVFPETSDYQDFERWKYDGEDRPPMDVLFYDLWKKGHLDLGTYVILVSW